MAITSSPDTTVISNIPMQASMAVANGAMNKQAEAVRTSVARGAQTMQTELMRFMSEQMHSGSDMLQQMLKCAGSMELIQLQQQYLKTSTQSYTDEMIKLTRLATDMGTYAAKAN